MAGRDLFSALAISLALAATAQAAPSGKTAASMGTSATPSVQPQEWAPGPTISGLCVYRSNEAIELSNVGKAAGVRMEQLRAQVAAEVEAERQAIQRDVETLQAKRSTLTQEQLQQQAGPIQQRARALNQKIDVRDRELELTGRKAIQTISAQLEPIVRSLYQSHNCSLMVGQAAVLVGNPTMDLTQLAVIRLNNQISSVPFDREQLPQR
jgi:Skp family chaperone for outer membrane proteins